MRAALVGLALLLGWTDAQAASVLLKGHILSIRPPAHVRLAVDAVLAGHWRARVIALRLRHITPLLESGTAVYVVFKVGAHGSPRDVSWDITDNGVCLTPAQQHEYRIDPATLPAAERCNPE